MHSLEKNAHDKIYNSDIDDSLKNRKWKPFIISDLFCVSGTATTSPQYLVPEGSVPRITCSSRNNAVGGFYQNEPTERGGVLTVDSAAVGYIAYHPYSFIATDHVEKIISDQIRLSQEAWIFIAQCIRTAITNKYNYGYKFSQDRIKRQIVRLPIDDNGQPDWDFMESYGKHLINKSRQKYLNHLRKTRLEGEGHQHCSLRLNDLHWSPFQFTDVFEIKGGYYNKKPNMKYKGKIPFLGATEFNNGVTGFLDRDIIEQSSKTGKSTNHPIEKKMFPGNCICVTNDGSVGYAYYQPSEFTCSHSMTALYLNKISLTRYIAIFLIAAIEKQRVCFTYARKWRPKRMKHSKIMLPVDSNGQPDWDLMESYGKTLIQQAQDKYLKYMSYP